LRQEQQSAQSSANFCLQAIGDVRKVKGAAAFSAVFDGLEQELADLQAMVTSSSLETVKAAEEEIKRLNVRLHETREGLTAEDGEDTPNFAAVTTKIAELDTRVKAALLTGQVPTAQAKLLEQFVEVQKKVKGQTPAEGLKTLADFETTAIAALEKTAGEIRGERSNVPSIVTQINNRIKTLKELGSTPKFAAHLEAERDRLKKLIEEEEDSVFEAVADLRKLDTEAYEATTGPGRAAAQDKEKKLVQEEAQLKKDRAAWKGMYKGFTD